MDFSLNKVIYIHTNLKLKNGHKTSLIYKIQLSDNHTVQKIELLVMGFFTFHRLHFRLAEENHILKSWPQKTITNTYTLKYETSLPDIFNKLQTYCIFNHPE